MNKKQKGGVEESWKKDRKTYRSKGTRITKEGGKVETESVDKTRRKGRIRKQKYKGKLLAGEPGSTYSTKTKSKYKDDKLKKKKVKVVDKEGRRKTKTKVRVTRKGVVKKKTVVWEDGKRKVIKTRDGKVVKKKGYQTGGFLESPIEEI